MPYERIVFVDGSAPYLNAENLNRIQDGIYQNSVAVEAIPAKNSAFSSSSSGGNFIITTDTRVPIADNLPLSVTFIPVISNNAGATVTTSWSETPYPIYDYDTGKPVEAGVIKANQPVSLTFDGSKFYFGSGAGTALKYGSRINIAGMWDKSASNPSASTPITYNGYLYATRVYGGVWNDIAESRECVSYITPGNVVVEVGDDTVKSSDDRLIPGAMIASDTYGLAIGEFDDKHVPVAIAGRALAYFDGNVSDYKVGTPVCSGRNGMVSAMTREEVREYPDCIIGTVCSIPTYEEWNGVKVNGRIWIKVR